MNVTWLRLVVTREELRVHRHSQKSFQRQHFILSYFKTLSVGSTWGLNPQSPALKSEAQPTEPPVIGRWQWCRGLTGRDLHHLLLGIVDDKVWTPLSFKVVACISISPGTCLFLISICVVCRQGCWSTRSPNWPHVSRPLPKSWLPSCCT